MKGHLIHIGFPKSGSTFLQVWFQQHPHLFYKFGGLGGFASVFEIGRNPSLNLDDFTYMVTSDEALSIPVSSSRLIPIQFGKKDSPVFNNDRPGTGNVCKTLKNLYPHGKILLITRGFKGVVMSGYSQYLKVGGVLDINGFFERNFSWMKNQADNHIEGTELNFSFIVETYEEAFGRDNVIVLPYELLRDDQHKFISMIEDRLGLPHAELQIGRINESLSPEEFFWYPRISWLVSGISRRFGEKCYTWVYSWYVQKTINHSLRGIVRFLVKMQPDRHKHKVEFDEGIWDQFRKNHAREFAGKLKNIPVYTPYLSEYMIDEK